MAVPVRGYAPSPLRGLHSFVQHTKYAAREISCPNQRQAAYSEGGTELQIRSSIDLFQISVVINHLTIARLQHY